MALRGIRSIDVVLDEVQRERQMQLDHFHAIDSKAGIVMGFAGALVALSPAHSRLFVDLARAAAVASGVFSLSTFWPRRYWSTDLRPLRNKYLAAEPEFTRLHILDTKIEMTERMGKTLFGKALRLKVAMTLLAVAVLLTALGLGLQ